MLSKMGWNKDKGLGANEDGQKEFITLRYKNNSNGMGYQDKDDQWTENETNFDSLLKSLNSTETAEEERRTESLEEKSKGSRARVHYKKFTRGKDTSRYSAKDLANIFGKKTLDEEREEKMEVKCDEPEQEDPEQALKHGVETYHSTVSSYDYFKVKLGKFYGKKEEGESGSEDHSQNQTTAQKEEAMEKRKTDSSDKQQEEEEEVVVAKKDKKKKKKKRKVEEEIKQEEELPEEPAKKKKKRKDRGEAAQEEIIEEPPTEDAPKKDKKKTKKSKSNKSEIETIEILDNSTAADNPPAPTDAPVVSLEDSCSVPSEKSSKKKKKRTEKENSSNNDQEVIEVVSLLDEDEERPAKKQKKSKNGIQLLQHQQ